MSVIKTKGIVLKYCNMNDNDRLFTLFCPEIGKISALSKGIRSHKHKDFAALQPFCFSEFVIDNSKGLGYITSAQVCENFYALRESVEKTSLASYITDLVSGISDEIIYEDDFFRFILNTLYVIAKTPDSEHFITELLKFKSVFELKTVCVAGYMPATDICMVCNCKKDLKYFDVWEGGTVCEDCQMRGASPELVEISSPACNMIKFICDADYKAVFKFNASPETIDEVNRIGEIYLINKLEFVSAQLEYFKNIISQ